MLLAEIRGQNSAVRTLNRAVAEDRLPNAYLFEGPSGVGKQTTAMALAKARLCPDKPRKGCLSCSICTRISAGLHPDVRIFAPREEGSRNIQVEFVRSEILRIAQYAPFEAPAAFLIFPEADVSFPEAHPEAANALLKTLEEPRPNLCFVLIAERPERLLTTIRSRCQRLRFGRLPELVLAHVLESQGVPEAQHEAAIALAEGQADRALALIKDGMAAHLLGRALRVEQTLASKQTGRLVQLSEELSKADDCTAVLEMLTLVYRDVAARALHAPHESLRLPSAEAEVGALAARIGPRKAAENVQKLAELPELMARNANLQITLDHLLMSLHA
jgi:DNA polymerase-3 subunit delta'